MTSVLVVYVFMGAVAGYVSARLYIVMGGLKWKSNALATALFVPGTCFSVFFTLNLFLWGAGSSAAIPFTTLLALLCLWFGISLPLTFFGAFLGFRKHPIEQPVKTNQIPREIPEQNWLSHTIPTSLMGGILPFGCVFIQLFFILSSIWGGQIYYMFGFLLLAFVVLVVVCAQTSIIICYFHLGSEDYRWWWRSFFSTGTRPFSLPPLPPHSYWWVQAFLQSVSPSLSSFLLVGLISMVERNCNKRCPYYRGVLISGVSLERGVPLYTFS
ncbi:Transmembrane 9 superfamily member 2, partial [Geodia barretti]